MKIEDSSLQDDVDFNSSQQELIYRYDTEDVQKNELYLDERKADHGNMSVCSQISEPITDGSFVAKCNQIQIKLQDMYASIADVTSFEDELSITNKERLVVTVEKLLELKGDVCTHLFHNGNSCGLSFHYEISQRGAIKVVQWSCDQNTLVSGVHLKSLLVKIKSQVIIMICSL